MFRALCRFPPDLLSSAGDESGEPPLIRMANAQNVSFPALHGGSIYLINLVDKSIVLCFASPLTQHHSFSRNQSPCLSGDRCAIFLHLFTVEENELGFA